MTQDIWFRGGSVLTMSDDRAEHTSFVVRDGEILAVGGDEVGELCGPDPQIVDLAGATVVPGLIDAHAHLEMLACAWWMYLDCRSPGVGSIGEIVDRIAAEMRRRPEGEWIIAQGNHFQDAYLAEGRYPDRYELDRAGDTHPVVFRASSHMNIFNSVALERLGVDRDTPDAPGGRIERLPDGELTGRTFDMWGPLGGPEPTVEQLAQAMVGAQQSYLAAGVTAIGDIPLQRNGLLAVIESARTGRLRLRVEMYPKAPTVTTIEEFSSGALQAEFDGFDPETLHLRGIKLFLDGGMTSLAAALHEEYAEAPGYYGELTFTPEQLDEVVDAIAAAGLQGALHVLGDRAFDEGLRVLSRELPGSPDAPHRLEHAGNLFATPERLATMREHGILPVPQMSFINTTALGYRKQLGSPRGDHVIALKSMMEAGLRVPGSSDAVGINQEQHIPMFGIRAAVTRKAYTGEVLNPEEAITVEDALWMYTRDAAFAIGREDDLGSIEPGKKADFAVFDVDPRTVAGDDLMEVAPVQTWVNGECAYRRDGAEES